MKIFLDDIRDCPLGWVPAKTAQEAIDLLKSNVVDEISLDHDLGPEEAGTGYDVVCWMEEQTYINGYIPPNKMTIHSANPVGRKNMQNGIDKIYKYFMG